MKSAILLSIGILLCGINVSQAMTSGTLLLTGHFLREKPGHLMIMDLRTGRVDTLVKANDSIKPMGPCFSPDGREVAFYADARKRIRIINLATRAIRAVGPDVIAPRTPLSWAGDYIFTTYGWSRSLHRVNVNTGVMDTAYTFKAQFEFTSDSLVKHVPGIYMQGNVSRDGKRGAYTLTRANNRVIAFDAETQTETILNNGNPLHPSCQASMSPSGEYATATNHSTDWIKKFNDNASTGYHRRVYGGSFWFNRWSYNSENDLTYFNSVDSFFMKYRMDVHRKDKLIRGLCAWNMDTRGWVLDTVPPAAPVALRVFSSEHHIRLVWSRSGGANAPLAYVVDRNGIRVGETTDTCFVDSGLNEGATYHYSVSGRSGGVALSAPLSADGATIPDQQPPRLVAAYSYGASVDLIFSEPLSAASVTAVSQYTLPAGVTVTSAALTAPNRVHLITNTFAAITDTLVRVTGIRDLAQTPNTILSDSIPLTLVRDLVVSTARPCTWAFIDSGAFYQNDDTERMVYRPQGLTGLPYFQNSYKDGVADSTLEFMRFTISRPMEVLIAFDHTLKQPGWLTDTALWRKTGEFISDFDVYSRLYPAGTVRLNGSGVGEYSTYNVILRPILPGQTIVWTGKEVEESRTSRPVVFNIHPNPARGNIIFSCRILEKSIATVSIHDVTGRKLRVLTAQSPAKGIAVLAWNGKDANEAALNNGIYFCRLSVNGKIVQSKRMVIAR